MVIYAFTFVITVRNLIEIIAHSLIYDNLQHSVAVGWNTSNPITISVGTVSSPVTKLLNVHGKIWCAIQGTIKVLNVQQLQVSDFSHPD